MKAIETCYNGYRFRSRLEARWSVFFDAAGIDYRYEPEGFELTDGTRYLPDFFLPAVGVYVEVKSPARWTDAERAKIVSAAASGLTIITLGEIPRHGSAPQFVYFSNTREDPDDGFTYCKGGVFDPEDRHRLVFDIEPFPFLHSGVAWEGADGESLQGTISRAVVNSGWAAHLAGYWSVDEPPQDAKRRQERNQRILSACDAARQARFEFGETPRVGASR